MKGKALGGYLSGVRRRLQNSGYSDQEVTVLMATIVGNGNGQGEVVKLPRDIVKKIGVMIGQTKRAVIVKGKKGFKVFSVDGYARASAAVKKNRPWLSSPTNKIAVKDPALVEA